MLWKNKTLSNYRRKIQSDYWEKEKTKRRGPNHPVVMACNVPLAAIAAQQVIDPKNSSCLDVGCGNGFLTCQLENIFAEVVGIDFSQSMLEINPCRNKCLGDSTALPFPDKRFDVVVCSGLLHHLIESDRIQTLKEMQRVSRIAVVAFEPNRTNPLMFLFSLLNREEHMALKFSESYMHALFKAAGFSYYIGHVQGWIPANLAPGWWIPIGNFLDRTPMHAMGLSICCVGKLQDVR
jgi:SAM-dependent methyltransferase